MKDNLGTIGARQCKRDVVHDWLWKPGEIRERHREAGLIEKELQANPRSVRALKAQAYFRRMQGLDERPPGDGTRRGLLRRSPPG